MKALVIGATGATGKDLVLALLENPEVHEVHVFVRRKMDIYSDKLIVHIVDFDLPESWNNLVQGDVAFSCMGTTLKVAGSKEAQWRIDFTYQYNFAVAASENNVKTFVLLSAHGANSESHLFYSKMKGKLEASIRKLIFQSLIIVKPGILLRKGSKRLGERVVVSLLQFVNKLGLLKKYRPIPTNELATSMVNHALLSVKGCTVIDMNGIIR